MTCTRALAASTRPDVRLSHHGDGELRPVRAALLIEPDWIDYSGHLNMPTTTSCSPRCGRSLRTDGLGHRLSERDQLHLHGRSAFPLLARTACRHAGACDASAHRFRRQAHALFRAALFTPRKAGSRPRPRTWCCTSHDDEEGGALSRFHQRTACQGEGGPCAFAGSRRRRTADRDAGEMTQFRARVSDEPRNDGGTPRKCRPQLPSLAYKNHEIPIGVRAWLIR